jgi:FemAB-related protein (PEP-CTERM system-associated)
MNAYSSVAAFRVRKADLADHPGIVAFAGAELFHRPEWSLAVERGCRQRSHYLVAEGPDGALAGILPLTEMRSPLFGSALVSTGFGVGGGIIANNADAGDALAEAAWNLAQRLGCGSVELRGGRLPEGWERAEGTYAGFVRDLPHDEEAILKAIPRKQRAEVRRAQGFGFDVSIGSDASDRQAHYRVYSESVRNLGTPVFPRPLFEAMLDGFRGDADILTVRKDGQPLASVLSFYDKGIVYPYWGGGTHAARALRANEMMYFELMRHAAARGCTRFDFGRSKVGTGAFAYKKNWGFDPQPLVYAVRGERREINPLSPKYQLKIAAWQKLPLWLANRLGPIIARGLG